MKKLIIGSLLLVFLIAYSVWNQKDFMKSPTEIHLEEAVEFSPKNWVKIGAEIDVIKKIRFCLL